MSKYETHEFDVVVIGAGGAGLRAAIESSAAGAKTALVCKSLLGKAHTVMAEGGVAAALANVDTRDNWQVHFRDTMKGGKYLNGEPCSIVRKTGGCCSAISADILIPAWRTSATAPDWR